MEKGLKPLGFNIKIAKSGSIPLELCQQKTNDIIIMDICMPITNLFEASKLFK
jgi:CheY-like chemotaxis protein